MMMMMNMMMKYEKDGFVDSRNALAVVTSVNTMNTNNRVRFNLVLG